MLGNTSALLLYFRLQAIKSLCLSLFSLIVLEIGETGSSISLNDYSSIHSLVSHCKQEEVAKSQIHQTTNGFAVKTCFVCGRDFLVCINPLLTCLQVHLERDADHESLDGFHHRKRETFIYRESRERVIDKLRYRSLWR